MLGWIAQHWVGALIGTLVAAYVVWWLVKPVSWKDGEGDNNSLVDAGSFKQFH